jgi:hypothetical protein
MKTNDKPLFHSYADDLKVGDLVTWRSFDQNENYETIIVDFKGAIIKIYKLKQFETGRYVYYAMVLPFGQTKTMEVPVHILKKETI